MTGNDTWQSGCLCQGVVGIHENAGPASLSLFPNPTKEQTRLELYGLQGERVTYTVSDMLGQRVAGADLGIRSGDWSGMIDLAHVVPGVYVLEVRIGDSLRSGRIIRY